MEISIFLTFFESNIYLFLLIIPFLAQIWIPLGAMFFILFAWALTNSFSELFLLFLIVLFSTVIWDFLSYFIARKFSNTKFFQYLLNVKKIKKLYEKSELFLEKKGESSIFLTRFLITGLGPVINYVAWFQSFKFKKFSLYIIFWEILYTTELLLLWYFFKDTFEEVFSIISNIGLMIFLAYLLYEIAKHLFFWKKKLFLS